MIRIALIGCENATVDYGEAASRVQRARLTAVVDPDDALAGCTADSLGAPVRATSFEQLLRDNADAFDAVVVRCAIGSVESVMEQVTKTGKHVLLDMPLLLGMLADDEPIAVCQSAGATVMLSQPMRFLPSVAEAKSSLESGSLGTPGLLRIHDWRPPNASEDVPSNPDEQVIAGEAVFQDLLPDVDLANWIFGSTPSEIFADGFTRQDTEQEVLGYVQLHLGYADGGMALVDRCVMLPPGSDYFSLSVFGSDGAAYADDHRNMHLLYQGGRPTALPAGQGKLHHLAELQEFVDAIAAGRPPAITADDGFRAEKVLRAADLSLKCGRAMKLVGSNYEFV